MNIAKALSPNFTKGRQGYGAVAIVDHIAEGTLLGGMAHIENEKGGGLELGTMQEFASPKTEKSSHYLIGKDLSIIQFVEEKDTAWGNGYVMNPTSKLVLSRPGVNPNLYTISIEHEGFAIEDITEGQYKLSAELHADIAKRWSIPLNRHSVIGHREIRTDKVCPGKISIEKLIALAIAPVPTAPDEATSFFVALYNWIKAFFS